MSIVYDYSFTDFSDFQTAGGLTVKLTFHSDIHTLCRLTDLGTVVQVTFSVFLSWYDTVCGRRWRERKVQHRIHRLTDCM